jgi:hypothetical protein
MISQEKLDFLGRMSYGIYEIIEIEDMAVDIYRRPRNRVEQYIIDSFMGFYGCFRPICIFSPDLFIESLEVITEGELSELLEYFESRGVGLLRVYKESRSVELSRIDEEIRSGRMKSFRQFIEFK